MKAYLRAVVKGGDRTRAGMGVELFRLDAADAPELTEEEAEAVDTESETPAANTAVMRIYEEIGEDFWTGSGITAKSFAEELESFGPINRLNIHINCLGGDVFAAQAIHSTVADHKAEKKTAYIDGVCASAATVIACGANEVIARHNTSYMIHHPWALAVGDAETMRKAARDLDAITVPILSVYKNKVGDKLSEDEIRQLMADETWMTPEEALERGFVDTVRGKIRAIARVGAGQIMCSGKIMDAGRYAYRNMPRWPLTKQRIPAATAAAPPQNKEKGKPMTLEDITPELRATIEDGARAAERTRLAALDALNGPGLEDIVARAKAENKQPNDIALECLAVTKGQLSASQATSALARDAAAARAVPAGDAPGRKPAEKPEAAGARLVANAFKSQKPRGLANAASPNGHLKN